jgi:hypothetical protein
LIILYYLGDNYLYFTMAGRAKSDTKKVQIAREAYDNLKSHAIKAYIGELAKEKGKGARTVTEDFVKLYKLETGKNVKLNYGTLIRGARSGRSRAKANAARAWLTDGKTNVIIAYIAELGN